MLINSMLTKNCLVVRHAVQPLMYVGMLGKMCRVPLVCAPCLPVFLFVCVLCRPVCWTSLHPFEIFLLACHWQDLANSVNEISFGSSQYVIKGQILLKSLRAY